MKTDMIDENMGEELEFLDVGPNALSERRLQSLVRPPATKRKKNIHVEEPATKRSIVGEMTNERMDWTSTRSG